MEPAQGAEAQSAASAGCTDRRTDFHRSTCSCSRKIEKSRCGHWLYWSLSSSANRAYFMGKNHRTLDVNLEYAYPNTHKKWLLYRHI